MPKTKIILAISILVLVTLACNAILPNAEPVPTPIIEIEPGNTPSTDHLPQTEEDVPRVVLEEALVALHGGAWFRSGDAQLHIGVENDFHPARKAHPAFLVDDLDVVIEKVQLAGYEWDLTQPPLDGFKRAHIFDPFGNRIELMEKI